MASSLVSASLAGIAGTFGVWLGLSSLSGSSPQASLGFLQAWRLGFMSEHPKKVRQMCMACYDLASEII